MRGEKPGKYQHTCIQNASNSDTNHINGKVPT